MFLYSNVLTVAITWNDITAVAILSFRTLYKHVPQVTIEHATLKEADNCRDKLYFYCHFLSTNNSLKSGHYWNLVLFFFVDPHVLESSQIFYQDFSPLSRQN